MESREGFHGRYDGPAVAVFDRLGTSLLAFNNAYDLFLRRWLHNYPMWGFFFLHPLGGAGSVQLSVTDASQGEERFATCGEWHIDDYSKLTRCVYEIPLEYFQSATEAEVLLNLKKTLRQLLVASLPNQANPIGVMPRPSDGEGLPKIGEFERPLRFPTWRSDGST